MCKKGPRSFFDSPVARLVYFVSAIVTIFMFVISTVQRQPAGTTNVTLLSKTLSSAPADRIAATTIPPVPRGASVRPTTVQTSRGVQSPNLSNVKQNVNIRYGSTTVTETPEASAKISAIPPATSTPIASTTQTSYGAQSPNVSGVGGDVDIRYGPLAPGSSGEAVEGK
jgi:hypothetical protein